MLCTYTLSKGILKVWLPADGFLWRVKSWSPIACSHLLLMKINDIFGSNSDVILLVNREVLLILMYLDFFILLYFFLILYYKKTGNVWCRWAWGLLYNLTNYQGDSSTNQPLIATVLLCFISLCVFLKPWKVKYTLKYSFHTENKTMSTCLNEVREGNDWI